MAQRTEHFHVVALQRLRRVLHQVGNRRNWGLATSQRWRLLFQHLNSQGEAPPISHGAAKPENEC